MRIPMQIRRDGECVDMVVELRDRPMWTEVSLDPGLRMQWQQDIADGLTDVIGDPSRSNNPWWKNQSNATKPANLPPDGLRKAFESTKDDT